MNKQMENKNDIEQKVQVISIDEKLSILFLHIPNGFTVSDFTFENHIVQKIGRLKQFNRIKLLKNWKNDNSDLVKLFTDALLERNWDFNKFPNPIAYITYYCENN